MTRVNVSRPKKATRRAAPKVEAASPVELAESAVTEFENRRAELYDARDDWSKKFPDASAEQEQLAEFQGEVMTLGEKARTLVRAAEVSIGDFKFIPKSTTAHWEGLEILKILVDRMIHDTEHAYEIEPDTAYDLSELAPSLAMLKTLLDRDIVTQVAVQKDAAEVFFINNPHIAEVVGEAWDEGGQPLTPQVSKVKI